MALLFSFWWDLFLVFVSLVGVVCYLLKQNNNYWKNKGMPGPEPQFFFGNSKKLMLGKTSLPEQIKELYDKTKQLPYVGVFLMQRPTLIINDLDMIKTILITDFNHFTDRALKINVKNDPVADHLFAAAGTRWKNMRVKMTPTFTSNKMKEMFNSIGECCQEMISYLHDQGDDQIEEMKELFAKLDTNIIGTCAFGIECNTFKNPNSKFREMGRKIFDLPWYRMMMRILVLVAPKITYNCGFSLLGKETNDFFYNTVKDAIEYRKKNGIVRKDFLNILMQMLKEDNDPTLHDGNKLTLQELSAQVFIFFVAGFETSSTAASFALYELALNPDIQNRLHLEIDETLKKYDGKITYDSLTEMTYLNQVIEESMRKYPPVPVLLRMCTKDYQMPDSDINIETDTAVMISVYGIHKNPDIYQDPEKFDPDRFSPENKATRHHMAYLPFGDGPRNCIGSRFGLMQTRLCLAMILSKYEVAVCEKTPIPMKFKVKPPILTSESGIWLKLKNRK